MLRTKVRKYLARYFRTGTKPIWQSGLSRSTYPFPQDLKRSPVRTLLTASLNRGATSVRTLLTTSLNRGQHQPWEWSESPHGGMPARESHALPDGCGGHHLRFCENGLDW